MMCNICGGDGTYPIIDMNGRERYAIRCPECFGSGLESEPEPPAAPTDLAPTSTAAKIKTLDELREHVAEHWHR